MNLVTHFAQPLWIVAGLIAMPVLLLLYGRFDQLQRRRVAAFSLARDTDSAHFGVSPPLLWTKRTLLGVAVFAACVALARPLGAMRMEESERRGLDILFAIDTSRSMLTPDVKPDRLTRARLAVEDLLDQLNGDGVGLVAFAGEAFLQAPVTTDYDAFKESLDALDTHTIALGGTDIAAAIRLSEATLALRGDTQKVMVLLTDGEDLAGDALLAAHAAAKKGMVIFSVGVGTAAGELIPIPDSSGGTEFVKDPEGKFVKSRLDSDMLRQIAAATGGVYTPLGPQGQGVVRLYQDRLKGLAQRQHADRRVAVYAELFQWPLGVAIALLSLAWLLGVSVRRRVPVARPAMAALLALVIGVAMMAAPRARASPLTAQKEYQQGRYLEAQREYAQSLKTDPNQSHLQFNLGAAAYKAGDFAAAGTAFSNALRTREIPLQQSAYYNLGNALFRQGEKLVTSDPQSTIATWQRSLGAFDTALQLKPSDADAKFNRNVVKTRLDELRRQQQQQQQQKQNQGAKDDQDKSQDQKDQKDQKGQQSQNGPQDQQHQPQNPQQNQQGQQGQQNQHTQQPNQQTTQNQQGPQPAGPTKAEPSQRSGEGSEQGDAAAAQDIGKPDQLSRLEAEQLLDSVKGEERHLAAAQNGKAENRAAPLRDW